MLPQAVPFFFTWMKYNKSKEFALKLDKEDPLKRYREEFHIPLQDNGDDCLYFCGNSLGLQPKKTAEYVNQELKDWAKLGVEGHFNAKNPWMPYHEFLTESFSKIVGAKKEEVVAMNTLTTNLHLMMVSFYRPNKTRYKIVIEADAFPSDIYAVSSQIQFHGFDVASSLIKLKPRVGEVAIRKDDIEKLIEQEGDTIALIMIGGVNYYTGQVFDMAAITDMGHKKGIVVGFDLAHAAGNILVNLHEWEVDFAVWCTYKYLNSGPGSIAGCFIHEKHHHSNLPRFAGWWGHNKENRFNMPADYEPIHTAEGWQLSNPPILSLSAIRASLSLFDEVGMEKLTEKSKHLSDYLTYLLGLIKTDIIEIITPDERGCQLSIRDKNSNKKLYDYITKKGVIADWREPDVIRIAPVPLYNSFIDLYHFYKILEEAVSFYSKK